MKHLTPHEVATILKVHPRTVMRWLHNEYLVGYKLGTSKTSLWRIPEVELTKFIEGHK